MVIFKKTADLREYLTAETAAGKGETGFVPTMGALHAGHRSLIEKARKEVEIVVCSIFINPTQFNDKADFERYPVTTDNDILLLTEAGCDVLFLPAVDEVYPEGTNDVPAADFGYLDTILEGAQRPGHFRGVGQVVKRLLDIVQPDYIYLGQKDLQQCLVIKKLLAVTGSEANLIVCPTVREADGLAMSSRNKRLTEPQRALAGIIYQCLVSIQTKQLSDSFAIVQKECIELMERKGLKPEYVVLADVRDMSLLEEYDAGKSMTALIAAKLGDVRLIDNILLNEAAGEWLFGRHTATATV